MFPEVTPVYIEDRIFDIYGLDHPGGRFIWNLIKGRELSRYFFGSQEFEFLDQGTVMHKHTPFAQNLLESRFIGLTDDPGFFIEMDCDDPDALLRGPKKSVLIDIMPNIDSVFSNDVEKVEKMNNKRLDYHWSVKTPTPVSKELYSVQ